MSDSELSDAPSTTIPSDAELETSLRKEVRRAAKAQEEYTLRTIRAASEKKLQLPGDFYKNHNEWNSRSKTIIKHEVDNVAQESEISGSEAAPSKTKAAAKARIPPKKKESAPKRGAKRSSPQESPRPRKKQKPVSDDSESESLSSPPSDLDEVSEEEEEVIKRPVKKPTKKAAKTEPKKPKAKPKAKPPPEEELGEEDEDQDDSRVEEVSLQKVGNSESEMSDVVDDEPVKKRGKANETSDPKPKKQAATSKSKEEADPDKEEIKKLQGWLVKCGIRKVWGKELKPYETSKAKVKHLKEMLSDVGMTGRLSNEKAASIKEARELAADIEAVQEGAQRWGKDEDEDEADDGVEKTKSGRRLIRGAKNYDFLSSDGEETD